MKPELQLQELGLTKNESKVYIALLEIGLTTTTAIIKKVGINTSKVYESLERLLKKGLVSYSVIKNKKHWHAEDPSRIKEFLEEEKSKIKIKEKNADLLIPLLKIRESTKKDAQYKIFEGVRGIKTSRENALNQLKKGDTFYIILSNYPNDKKLEGYWADFQTRRAKKGINSKHILNEDLKKIGKKRGKLPLTQVKFVSKETLSPTWIEIYNDTVGIGVLGEEPSIFIIKNKEVATGFINYFNFLWKTGKK